MRELQEEAFAICSSYFPDATNEDQLLNIGEEVGELMRAVLKSKQGIRGTPEYWAEEARKEFGDIVVSLLCFAERAGFDAESATVETLQRFREKRYRAPN
jgi:NTP pyrophosphatase (non-canonical NTP hydrolase)